MDILFGVVALVFVLFAIGLFGMARAANLSRDENVRRRAPKYLLYALLVGGGGAAAVCWVQKLTRQLIASASAFERVQRGAVQEDFQC